MSLLQEAVQDYEITPDQIAPHDFFVGLRNIYRTYDIDPNGNEFPLLREDGQLDLEKLHQRSDQFLKINSEILSRVENQFGINSDLYQATEIMFTLTEPINKLFITMMRDKQQGRNAHSWIQCKDGEEQVQNLRQKIQSIVSETKYDVYFSHCPETVEILKIFADKLPFETSFAKRVALIEKIDEYSQRLYDRGMPTWIVTESTYYTDMYPQEDEDGWIPEPTLRLIFPSPDRQKLKARQISNWEKLSEIHGEQRERPHSYVGWQIATSGSDIPSLSTAEWLTNKSIIYIVGSFKAVPLIIEVAKRSNVTITEEEVNARLLEIYETHEHGHGFAPGNSPDRALEELDTDLTTLVCVLPQDEKDLKHRAQIILCLLCEYAKQGFQTPTQNVVIDGYRISGARIITELFNQGFVTFTDVGFAIHPEKQLNVADILADHQGIHQNNLQILSKLKNL